MKIYLHETDYAYVSCVVLTEDRNQWQPVLNGGLHLFCKRREVSRVHERLSTFRIVLGTVACIIVSSQRPSNLTDVSIRHRSHRWFRRYATSRRVAGSSPDEVNKLFQFT
jgi:hypothetical protein